MPKVPASRTRRSKAEVEKEFEKIAEDAAKRHEASNPKIEELSKVREQEIRQGCRRPLHRRRGTEGFPPWGSRFPKP